MGSTRSSGALAGMLVSFVAFVLLAGCESAQEKAAKEKAAEDAANAEAESQSVAVSALGREAQVLLRGDLALNGGDEVLVVNRFRDSSAAGSGNSAPIYVTRAALLEKDNGQWSELLHCDEHLKNPNGYLRGFPRSPVYRWRLEYSRDPGAGIEMKFTPAEAVAAASATPGEGSTAENSSFEVRWNKSTKRYQSFDRSHERFLNELPTLETPESYLR
jgi:hypothetical protein